MNSLPQKQAVVTRWLTPKQYAEKYQIDLSTVYRWVHAGRLPHMQNGKIIRVRDEEEQQ